MSQTSEVFAAAVRRVHLRRDVAGICHQAQKTVAGLQRLCRSRSVSHDGVRVRDPDGHLCEVLGRGHEGAPGGQPEVVDQELIPRSGDLCDVELLLRTPAILLGTSWCEAHAFSNVNANAAP